MFSRPVRGRGESRPGSSVRGPGESRPGSSVRGRGESRPGSSVRGWAGYDDGDGLVEEDMGLDMKYNAGLSSPRSGPFSPSISSRESLVHEDESKGNTVKGVRSLKRKQYLERLVKSQTGRRGQPPALGTSVQPLVQEVKVRGKDVAVQCSMCNGEFEVGKCATRMPCNHIYHAKCIIEWFAQKKCCPACRCMMFADDPQYAGMYSSGRVETSSSGGRSRVSHILPVRASMTTFQQAQAETSTGPASSGNTVSSSLKDVKRDADGDVIMTDA